MLGLSDLASLLRENTGAGYKNVMTQIRELSTLLLRGHMHPSEYYKYAMSKRGVTMSSIAQYLGNYTYWTEVQPKLSDRRWRPLLQNKWFFHLHFQNIAPLPRTFRLYHREYGLTTDGHPLTSKRDIYNIVEKHQLAGLVAKPIRGWKGEDVIVIKEINDEGGGDEFVARDGSHMTLSELSEKLDRNKDGEAVEWIIQEYLAQDEQMNAIAPHGSHTLRVLTIVDADGRVQVPSAGVQMGGADSMVDSPSQGGVAAEVDVSCGVVGTGLTSANPGRTLRRVPGADEAFTGKTIPMWQDVLETAERLARATPGVRAVGWDLMISDGRVFVLEGNDDWDLIGPQSRGGGLLNGAFLRALESHGIDLDAPDLPPIRPMKALKMLGVT